MSTDEDIRFETSVLICVATSVLIFPYFISQLSAVPFEKITNDFLKVSFRWMILANTLNGPSEAAEFQLVMNPCYTYRYTACYKESR